ncbi:signal peptidase I [Sutcliffiella halmapala]|uniref:signal peptidase I n=1 Tax=Sutcliffiella halmapala TaxID=79882 RepID=UPI0009954286|nr:signal peptidase I [Sutcliffiella halmapala]
MKNKKGKRIAQLVFFLLLILIIYMAVSIYQAKKNGADLPQFFGYTPLVVLSNSMNPYLETGDLVFVKRIPLDDNIAVGDVVTFREEADKFITHRVVEIVEENGQAGLITQGDNNNTSDEKIVVADNFIGKEVLSIPKIGLFSNLLSQPIGFMLFLVLPFTGFVFLTVYEKLVTPKGKKA